PVCQTAALRDGRRCIVVRIGTGIVVDAILADEWIDRQQCTGAERVLIPGSHIKRYDFLTLVLVQLVQAVRNLEPVARKKHVDVHCIFVSRYEIESVEGVFIVARSMNRIELGCIEKSAGTQSICSDEPSSLRPAHSKTRFQRRSAE